MPLKFVKNLFSGKEDLRNLYTTPPLSLASKFPKVPVPEGPLTPELLAARWTCGDLACEAVPKIAADLLERGFDTPSLRRLAGETQIRSSADAEPLIARVFTELGIAYPLSDETAQLIASRQIAREVIAGTRNPWAAASHLEIVIWNRIAGSPELDLIFSIHDEIKWDSGDGRNFQTLNAALLDAFARLALTG